MPQKIGACRRDLESAGPLEISMPACAGLNHEQLAPALLPPCVSDASSVHASGLPRTDRFTTKPKIPARGAGTFRPARLEGGCQVSAILGVGSRGRGADLGITRFMVLMVLVLTFALRLLHLRSA